MSNYQRTGSALCEEAPSTATAVVPSTAAPRVGLETVKPFLYEEQRPLPEPMLLRNHPTKVQCLIWEAILIGGRVMPLKLVSYCVVDTGVRN